MWFDSWPELTIPLIAMRLGALLLIAAVQGLTVAGIAVLLGDAGPRHDGRLSALPFGHIDALGLACTLLFGLGWGKPVAIETGELRFGRAGLVLVILGATAALVLLALVLLVLANPLLGLLPYTTGLTAAAFVRLAARLSLSWALFNLLPIPPLTGGHWLGALGIKVPRRVETICAVGLALAVVAGLARFVVAPVYNAVAPWLLATAIGL